MPSKSNIFVTIARVALQLALLFLPLYYLRFQFLGLPSNVIEVLVFVSLLAALVAYFTKAIPKLWFPNLYPVLLILIGVGIGSKVSLDHRVALGILKSWFLVPIIVYYLLVNLFVAEELPRFYILLFINTMAVSVYALFQYAGVIPLLSNQANLTDYLTQHRAIGFYESPNYLAMYLVPLVLLLSGFWAFTESAKWRYWLIALVAPISAIFLSGSRAGYTALIIGLLFLIVYKARLIKRFPVATASGLVILAVLLTVTLSSTGGQSLRIYIWQHALQFIGEHPIFGIGPGQFQLYFQKNVPIDDLYVQALPYALHPHNIFLNYWLSTGIIGLSGFVWMLSVMAYRAFSRISTNKLVLSSCIAALLGIIVHGLFDSTYFKNDLAIIFWMIAAFISLASRFEKNSQV